MSSAQPSSQMNIYNYLFYDCPRKRSRGPFHITICRSSTIFSLIQKIVTRRDNETASGSDGTTRNTDARSIRRDYINESANTKDDVECVKKITDDRDILSQLAKRGISYTACMQDGRRIEDDANDDCTKTDRSLQHQCDIHLIMIGSKVEEYIFERLRCFLKKTDLRTNENNDKHDILSRTGLIDRYKHRILRGSFLSNGSLQYSVFREVNNNMICHEVGIQKESTFYMYDTDFNRGHKFHLGKLNKFSGNDDDDDKDDDEVLMCKNRDGDTISKVDATTLSLYYDRCTPSSWHDHIHPDVDSQIAYMKQIRQHSRPIDSHKNKRYICYAQSVQICLDKLDVFDGTVMASCRDVILRGLTFWGISHTLKYEQSKSEHNKHYNKRMMMINMNDRYSQIPIKASSDGMFVAAHRTSRKRKRSTAVDVTTNAVADNLSCGERNDDNARVDLDTDRNLRNNNSSKNGGCGSGGGDGGAKKMDTKKMGSAEYKNGIIFKADRRQDQYHSLFVQPIHSQLHILQELQMTCQKLRATHVYSLSAKNVPNDIIGYICSQGIGNISTAGKNMLFDKSVEISFGCEDRIGARILDYMGRESSKLSNRDRPPSPFFVYTNGIEKGRTNGDDKRDGRSDATTIVVINNIVTKYAVTFARADVSGISHEERQRRSSLYREIVKRLKSVHKFAEILLRIDEDARFLCINVVAGIPFRKFSVLRRFGCDDVFLSRSELEAFYKYVIYDGNVVGAAVTSNDIAKYEKLVETTNSFLCDSFDDECGGGDGSPSGAHVLPCSSLAEYVNHKAAFTLPPKRVVSVCAYKSSLPNKAYISLAKLVNRNFQIYVDPEAFERDELSRNRRHFDRFDLIKRSFDNAPRVHRPAAASNMYFLNSAFGDVDGLNVEDAYVLDRDLDLHLWCVFSYAVTLDEPRDGYFVVNLPSIARSVNVSTRDKRGNASTVLFLMATVYSENDITFPVFKNVIVHKISNLYVFYVTIADEALIQAVRECETRGQPLHEAFRHVSLQSFSFDPSVSNKTTTTTTTTTAATTCNSPRRERRRRLELTVVLKSKSFDGVKLVNSFGQKGLATTRTDLKRYRTVEGPDDKPGDNINVVANNCSLISRCASGQLLQMQQNFPCTIKRNNKVYGIAGRVPYFITDNVPSLSQTPMRFDELQKTAYVANTLPLALNLRGKYNINNPSGRLYPRDSQHVLNLYESFVNSSFRMYRSTGPIYTTADAIETTSRIFDRYTTDSNYIKTCMREKKK